ncbi:7TM chemoreceptor [Dictyocaulus viviparus]|uniref:7TM chemoreceptor n=1 Tax=Dictyocaulus viviparus TaxID=29172 RepID=A0A0D8X9Y4_DICVI|nr:7TM chemoreceptor [Dictyocaulus viviparus]
MIDVTQSGLSTINSCVFGFISIALNGFLIFVIYKQKSRVLESYKYVMIACAIFDICFSSVYIVASPTFAATTEKSALLIVNGGIDMPTNCGRVLLIIFVFLFCQSIVISPSLFVFRYLQICRKHSTFQSFRRLRCLFLMLSSISTSVCGMICFAAWPTAMDLKQFTKIAYRINVSRNTTFLVATLQKNDDLFVRIQSTSLFAGIIVVIVLMIFTMSLMIFCSIRIIYALLHTIPANTRHIQVQVCKTLAAQSISPLILLHLPFYISILAPLFEARTGEASNYFPFLFAWCPVVNAVLVLYFVRDYRNFVVWFVKNKMFSTGLVVF